MKREPDFFNANFSATTSSIGLRERMCSKSIVISKAPCNRQSRIKVVLEKHNKAVKISCRRLESVIKFECRVQILSPLPSPPAIRWVFPFSGWSATVVHLITSKRFARANLFTLHSINVRLPEPAFASLANGQVRWRDHLLVGSAQAQNPVEMLL